nr:orotate phosphoribosyltransferase [bacterium]
MMTKEEVLQVLKDNQAVLEGHFQLTSGRHAARYVQCAKLFIQPKDSEKLCRELAALFEGDDVQLVIGPAMGAILIAYETARQLGVPNFFAERENGKMTLRRGFAIEPGTRVLVTEDVITTGGSVQEVIDLVRAQGGVPVGVGVLVDRSGGKVSFGDVPLKALLQLDVPSFEAEECPLCREGKPLYKPGSRASAK